MNDKITLQQLAEQLPTEIFGNDNDQRAMLVSELFALVAEMLEAGEKKVELPGLGSFELTGDASSPVLFNPDKPFAERVNAPFASFSPVDLAPNLSEDMLDAVVEVESTEADLPEIAENNQSISEELLPEDVEPLTLIEEGTEMDKESAAEQDVEERGEGNEAISEPAGPMAVINTESPEATPSEIGETLPEPEEELIAAEPTDEVIKETPEVVETSEDALVVEPIAEEISAPESEEETPEEFAAPSSSRFGIGFFWGILTGLLVGAIAFLVYVILTANVATTDSNFILDELEDNTAAIVED